MPDRRKHRGPHPADELLFAPDQIARLRQASQDLVYLLSRGYAETSALKLVGDRYQLRARQRMALMRAVCSDQALAHRRSTWLPLEEALKHPLLIDGYNVLITIESALSGGWLILGREGCLRDLSSLHGSYRRVEETLPAIAHIGRWLAPAPHVRWLLDAPVSNSGRLKVLIQEMALRHGWSWEVALSPEVDRMLIRASEVVITADGPVLDRVGRWTALTEAVRIAIPEARILDLLSEP